MEILSPIHGTIVYEVDEIITFEKGVPGFQDLKSFIIKEVGEDSPFSILQSIEDKEIGFILISPFLVNDKYEIDLSKEIINNLKIESPDEVLLYSIVTLSSNMKEITANLKAPIIINLNTKKAEQYIIDKDTYKIKEKIFN
ncbi:MAG: flagellar assembly protein FliW [Clostridium sp.]|uniref:flagellar assembly protein FliW n=1 Tax=Clostridium sp. TaxID=1506 RepID=UPI0025BC8EE3|nr:flagellar assembly protein FliW [Clostridium sp.]MCF0147956.1 flagellar assembly protein FliW [Clostridium sp.]